MHARGQRAALRGSGISRRLWGAASVAVLATAGLAGLAAAPAQAQTISTWTGTAAGAGTPNPDWSDTGNWGSAPAPVSGNAVTFPALPSGCAACYQSTNDISGLSNLSLNLVTPTYAPAVQAPPAYAVTGNAVTLGSAGLTSAMQSQSSTPFNSGTNQLGIPMALGASQTWSVTGSGPTIGAFGSGPPAGGVTGGISGSPGTNTLGITLAGQTVSGVSIPGSLTIAATVEAGTVAVTGTATTSSGFQAAGTNGSVVLSDSGSSLNGGDGNPVTITDAGLSSAGSVGPLTATGAQIEVGLLGPTYTGFPEGTMTVDGSAGFDSASDLMFSGIDSPTTAGTSYPQLTATGSVNLGGAQLSLLTSCSPTLATGDTLTLVSAPGITGQLGYPTAPGGTPTPITNGETIQAANPGTSGQCTSAPPTYTFQINYTGTAVTATVTGITTQSSSPPPTTFSSSPTPPPPPTGASGSSSCASDSSSSSCSTTNAGTTVTVTGTGAVTLAQYSSDPVGNLSSGTEYFDVQASSGNSLTSVSIDDCNLGGGTSLSWWNPAANSGAGAWEAVTGSPGPTYSAGSPPCVTVTLTGSTSPSVSQLSGTVLGVSTASASPPPTPSPTPSASPGYWLAGSDGGIFSFGSAAFHGSAGGTHLAAPVVGMASTPDHGGYWLVESNGTVLTFGDATSYGSASGLHLAAPIVGMAATPDGGGYWLVGADGGIFSFGDAAFHGSAGAIHLNKSVVGMAATPDGGGYWLVGADGGVFSFGDAAFHGSAGAIHLNKPVVGMAATPDGGGYWLVASDGGIFSYGDAAFEGSAGAIHLTAPVVGMAGV